MKNYRIPEMTDRYASYDMIQTHTELPPLSDSRLQLLYAVLNRQQSLTKQSELYSLVISLVQLGLDTHDMIDTDTGRRTEQEMRSRQLKVLAGDYFSARFYHLLAQAGQIDMITRISGAVCEVNRLKVSLYTRMRQLKVSAEEYFNDAVQLKSGLFHSFTGLLEGAVSRLWPELLSGVSRCEVVLEELGRCANHERFEQSWAYWHVLQAGTDEERHALASSSPEPGFIAGLIDKYDIRGQLTAKLKQSAEAVKAAAAKLDSEHLKDELAGILDAMLLKLSGAQPALHEMR